MRTGVLLFVVGLILVGGILLWRSNVDPFNPLQSFQSLPPRAPVEESRLATPAAKHPATKPARVAQSTPAAVEGKPVPVEAARVGEIPLAAPPVVPIVPRDLPPFPVVDQIPLGVRETAVTTKYGDPALSAMTSTDGHTVETFVYTRDGGRLSTVIHLKDGRVSSAYTKTSPPRATGMSIPRHLLND